MRTRLHCCLVPIVSLVRKISPLKLAKSCAIWKKRSPRELFPNRIPLVSAEETWSYDDRDSSSPLYCRTCMMIGLCSCVVQMLMCTEGLPCIRAGTASIIQNPVGSTQVSLGSHVGGWFYCHFFLEKAQAVSNSMLLVPSLRFDIQSCSQAMKLVSLNYTLTL